MLETALGWTGRRGELEEALIEAGFLEKIPDGYLVLNWEQDQGHIWRNHERASKAAQGASRQDYCRCYEHCRKHSMKQSYEQKFPLLPWGLSPHPSLPNPLPLGLSFMSPIPVWL